LDERVIIGILLLLAGVLTAFFTVTGVINNLTIGIGATIILIAIGGYLLGFQPKT